MGEQVNFFNLVPKVKKEKRAIPIDLIYTTRPTDPASFVAADAGWLIGINSSDKRLYQTEKYQWAFRIEFVDNPYKGYNHQSHLDAVKFLKPKYATTRDYMSKEQCATVEIEYYPLEQILDWAEELSEYAQNVIVIPKVDVLDQIPERFMLGYSVPTKYGGTPLPIEIFKERAIHLLGGGWKDQLSLMRKLGNSCVSLDNNHFTVAAQYGRFTIPSGDERNVNNVIGYSIRNTRTTALCLSFGSILAQVERLQND